MYDSIGNYDILPQLTVLVQLGCGSWSEPGSAGVPEETEAMLLTSLNHSES